MVLIAAYGAYELGKREPKFPSPCGDYGSYLAGGKWTTGHSLNKFPSPCGDYGSYLRQKS